MKYKIVIGAIAIAFLAAGCNSGTNNSNSSQGSNQNQNQSSQSPTFSPITSGQPNVVKYTDSGFSPKTITIKQGDTVTFENNASDAVRVASNPHPLHTGYPTTGGCVGSTFDSCGDIAPGQMWQFKFDIAGSWGFHNHLNPSEGGTVVVQAVTSQSAPSNTTNAAVKGSATITTKTQPAPTSPTY